MLILKLAAKVRKKLELAMLFAYFLYFSILGRGLIRTRVYYQGVVACG